MDQNPEKVVSDRSLELEEEERRNQERMAQMPPEDRDSMDRAKRSGVSGLIDDTLTDEEANAANDEDGGRTVPPPSAQSLR